MTVMAEAFKKAIENKQTDINNLTWKFQDGKEKRLMDLSIDELQKCYNHCTDMLYNTNKRSPGKFIIKQNITNLLENCNAELLLRFIIYDCNIDTLKTNRDLLTFISNYKKEHNLELTDSVSKIFDGLPPIFESVTFDKLMTACFDKLDVINKKLISDKFIIDQGIWLTNSEKEELTEYTDNGQKRSWKEVIKERLILNPELQLKHNPNGLTYTEFRALVKLEPFSKISSLPTVTLKLLRDKILLLLDYNLDYHIDKWINIMQSIEKVAKYKSINLSKKQY